ncbi:MAG TPA: FkbM family methyltransferase [Brevundimonas sp.]|uniref:FkbM family methyltransferase n=1 Tax=Brevundimonas sp. TaxID=1871086 RepID=UPI00262A017A|nr:FkbM family methyltransferase [Brevundimonas sp.]HRO32767.1 FkbM family methyltransferase [Brevundimonas sp.]
MTVRKTLARAFRRLTGTRPQPVATTGGTPIARDRYFYLGPDQALVKLDNGLFLYVDPQDDHMSARIIADGHWESWVHACVLGLLKSGDRVIEVGANLGYYAVAMAQKVGPGGFLTSFEANPRIAALTQKSLAFNGFAARSRVIPQAALNEPGEISFVVSRRNSGGGFVTYWEGQPYEDGVVLKVPAVRLDDTVSGPIDMIRIDAEGSEPFILRGAEAILKANRDIVLCLEWSVEQMGSRTSVSEFVDWLSDMGFGFWRMGFDSSLQPVAPADMAGLDLCDVVMSRRDLTPPKA